MGQEFGSSLSWCFQPQVSNEVAVKMSGFWRLVRNGRGLPVDRGAWWAMVHRVTKSWTQLKWLSIHRHTAHWSGRFVSEVAHLTWLANCCSFLAGGLKSCPHRGLHMVECPHDMVPDMVPGFPQSEWSKSSRWKLRAFYNPAWEITHCHLVP